MKYLLPLLLLPQTVLAQDAADSLITNSAVPASMAPNPMLQIGMWILIGLVFYLLLIRPQQKRLKEHQSLIAGLRRGDKVVTSGGIVGTVQRVLDDGELLVKVADETVITVMQQYVTSVLNKSEPVVKKGSKKEISTETKD